MRLDDARRSGGLLAARRADTWRGGVGPTVPNPDPAVLTPRGATAAATGSHRLPRTTRDRNPFVICCQPRSAPTRCTVGFEQVFSGRGVAEVTGPWSGRRALSQYQPLDWKEDHAPHGVEYRPAM